MNSADSPFFLPLFFFLFFLAVSLFHEAPFRVLGHQTYWSSKETQHDNEFGRRVLMSFKEKPKGSNLTFECSPSGPCVPCLYSEKGDEKYRCSETGYRIPFKCIEIKDSTKDAKKTNSQKTRLALEISDSIENSHKVSHVAGEFTTSQSHRGLLEDSSPSENRSQAYITYRSCIPPVTEEKLSVIGFEDEALAVNDNKIFEHLGMFLVPWGVVIFLLLISGSIIYLRKKKAGTMSGYVPARTQTNSRF